MTNLRLASRGGFGLVTALALAGLVVAAPAMAASTNIGCATTSPTTMRCDLNAQGHAAQFSSVTWNFNGTTRSGASVSIFCPGPPPGDFMTISVSYLDGTGSPQTESDDFFCARNK